jgi:four helix bundle protein
MSKIRRHTELKVYELSFEVGMEVYRLTKDFPKEETYSLTDQIRRSSRSVSGNIAEAWKKRLYPKNFVSKLTDSDAEAGETQVWLQYANACGYLDDDIRNKLNDKYDHISAMLIKMMDNPDQWSINR